MLHSIARVFVREYINPTALVPFSLYIASQIGLTIKVYIQSTPAERISREIKGRDEKGYIYIYDNITYRFRALIEDLDYIYY